MEKSNSMTERGFSTETSEQPISKTPDVSSPTKTSLASSSVYIPMESNDLQRRGSDHDGHDAPHDAARDASAKCIETLPVEIQRQIMLCLPSLTSLGAIIRSSPVFYSLFQSEPKNFIANCLILCLGDAFLDACTARAAMQDDFQKERRDAMKMRRELSFIWPFLESYRKKVEELPCNAWIHSISLPEATQMATFHISAVEPLVEQYASWALANLGTPVKETSLSRTELMRIQRAMYRFQIVCDVFGNRLKDGNLSTNRPRHLGCLRFLSGYEPWEIEEILCINTFFQEQYEQKISEVVDELNPNSRRVHGCPPLGGPDDAVDLGIGRRLRDPAPSDKTMLMLTRVDRHKVLLQQLPREPGPPTPGTGAADPARPRGARGHPARQHAPLRVRHLAGRHNRQHGHAPAVGEVLLGA